MTAADILQHWGAPPHQVKAMRFKEAAFNEMCCLIYTCSDDEWERLKNNVIGFRKDAA